MGTGRIFVFALLMISIHASCRYSESDQSFTLAEYREMGMPDTIRLWSHEDYTDACATLNNIKAIRSHSLPRKDSRKSGGLFSKMIDTNNLAFLIDEKLSLRERAYRIQQYIDFQGCFVTAYTDVNSQSQYYHKELIDLYIFGLTIAQDMLDLGQLINEATDSSNMAIQYAFPSIQSMYLAMVLTILENQQKSHFFENEDLVQLSGFVHDSIKINLEWMGEAAKEQLRKLLENIVNGSSPGEVKKKYAILIASLG